MRLVTLVLTTATGLGLALACDSSDEGSPIQPGGSGGAAASGGAAGSAGFGGVVGGAAGSAGNIAFDGSAGASGSAGSAQGDACARTQATADILPVHLAFAFDVSGSMGEGDEPWHDQA